MFPIFKTIISTTLFKIPLSEQAFLIMEVISPPHRFRIATFKIFLLFLAGGILLSFLPIIYPNKMDSLKGTALESGLKYQITITGLNASISISLYVALVDFLEYLLARNLFQEIPQLLGLFALIIPYSVIAVYRNSEEVERLFPSVACSQMILLYSSFFLILNLSSSVVWSQRTLYLGTFLVTVGFLCKSFGEFFRHSCIILWISKVSLLLAFTLFIFKSVAWYFYINDKKRAGKKILPTEIICSYSVILLLAHAIVSFVTAFVAVFKYRNAYDRLEIEFVVNVFNNTALVIIYLVLRNQTIKSNMSKLQVFVSYKSSLEFKQNRMTPKYI